MKTRKKRTVFTLIMALVLGWNGVSFAQDTNAQDTNLNFRLTLFQEGHNGGP